MYVAPSSPGPNHTTSIYNASVVIFYNATGSLARSENKNILFYFEKHSILLQRWRCSYKFKSRRIGSWFRFKIAQYVQWGVYTNNDFLSCRIYDRGGCRCDQRQK
jgi:hypothetical protein